MLTLKALNSQIILVKATEQAELGQAFLRFQEHYESPEFKDKIFTEGQFRQWYSEKYGANTYERDWTGFNIPGSIFDPFVKGLFDPLTQAEQELVKLFRYRADKFYVIGAQDSSPETLEHEICHGLFYTNDSYRDGVKIILGNNPEAIKPVYEYIASLMYHPSVHEDEVHAWLSANSEELDKEGVKVDEKVVKQLQYQRKYHYEGE